MATALLNAAALASNPFTAAFAPNAYAQAGIAASVGVAQAALVNSRPIPQFEEGGVMPYTGRAIFSEAGIELMITPEGKLLLTGNNGAESAIVKKGTTFIDHQNTEKILSSASQSKNINDKAAKEVINIINNDNSSKVSESIVRAMREETDIQLEGMKKILGRLNVSEWNVSNGELNKVIKKGHQKHKAWRAKNGG